MAGLKKIVSLSISELCCYDQYFEYAKTLKNLVSLEKVVLDVHTKSSELQNFFETFSGFPNIRDISLSLCMKIMVSAYQE